jgi:ABC-type phosphate transport system substrate-binding protein
MLNIVKLFFVFLLAVFYDVSSVTAQDVVLIKNADVTISSLSPADVENIFLGKKTDWGNGSKIKFFINGETATHETFLKNYVGKSSSQFQTFWKKQVFTGKGQMPKSAGNDQEMVSNVTSTSGSIGYVSAGVDLGSAKTISVQ